MTIRLADNILKIKSIVIYTEDLEIDLPSKRLEQYGDQITVLDLNNDKEDFLTIEWRDNNEKVRLIKMIAKDEIKCIDIIPQ